MLQCLLTEGTMLKATACAEEEPARRPAHQEKLTVIGGALESAPKGIRMHAMSSPLRGWELFGNLNQNAHPLEQRKAGEQSNHHDSILS